MNDEKWLNCRLRDIQFHLLKNIEKVSLLLLVAFCVIKTIVFAPIRSKMKVPRLKDVTNSLFTYKNKEPCL